MKKFLTMTFVFTLASTTGVLGANNTQTCNNTINSCKVVKVIECDNLSNNNCNLNYNLSNNNCNPNNNCIIINNNCNPNNNCINNNNNCVRPELPSLDNENTETPSLDENLDIIIEDITDVVVEDSTENNTDVVVEDSTENNTDVVTEDTTNNDTTLDSILDIEKEVVELVNQERAKYGLSPLEIDTEVSYVARLKSQDMADLNYFSHTSPTYGTPFNMLSQFNISYKAAGENIAMGQKTAAEVVNAWMNSEGHRANILNSSYTHIGVGYVLDGNTPYWTQMFISK